MASELANTDAKGWGCKFVFSLGSVFQGVENRHGQATTRLLGSSFSGSCIAPVDELAEFLVKSEKPYKDTLDARVPFFQVSTW